MGRPRDEEWGKDVKTTELRTLQDYYIKGLSFHVLCLACGRARHIHADKLPFEERKLTMLEYMRSHLCPRCGDRSWERQRVRIHDRDEHRRTVRLWDPKVTLPRGLPFIIGTTDEHGWMVYTLAGAHDLDDGKRIFELYKKLHPERRMVLFNKDASKIVERFNHKGQFDGNGRSHGG